MKEKAFTLNSRPTDPAGLSSKLLFAASAFLSALFIVMLATTGMAFRKMFASFSDLRCLPPLTYWVMLAAAWLKSHYLITSILYVSLLLGAAVGLFGFVRRDSVRRLALWAFVLVMLFAWILTFISYYLPVLPL